MLRLRHAVGHEGKLVNVIGRRIRKGERGTSIRRGGTVPRVDGVIAVLNGHGVAQQASPATDLAFDVEGLLA
jgi:hypothetical protein